MFPAPDGLRGSAPVVVSLDFLWMLSLMGWAIFCIIEFIVEIKNTPTQTQYFHTYLDSPFMWFLPNHDPFWGYYRGPRNNTHIALCHWYLCCCRQNCGKEYEASPDWSSANLHS